MSDVVVGVGVVVSAGVSCVSVGEFVRECECVNQRVNESECEGEK